MSQFQALQTVTHHGLDEVERILGGASVIVHRFDGVIERWTAGCEALYGWSRAEAIGAIVHDLLFHRISGTDREHPSQAP